MVQETQTEREKLCLVQDAIEDKDIAGLVMAQETTFEKIKTAKNARGQGK